MVVGSSVHLLCVLLVLVRAGSRSIVGVHLSLLPRPQRLALHLSSINHRALALSFRCHSFRT